MIEFRLLGSLDLKGPEGTLRSVLAQPKRVALLAYLAVARPDGYHRRDKLLGLFWPESDQERGRGALRKALYFLRQSLGEEVIVSRGDEEIGLAEGVLSCDVVAFEEALERNDPEEALDLYRGDLLEGFFIAEAPEFERWLEGERTRLRNNASEAAWALVDEAEAAGNGVEAARRARQAVSFTPADEAALRRQLELLDRLGNRSGAIQEYESFARWLRDEYEAEPSPETQALIASIREGDVEVASGSLQRPVESPARIARAATPEPIAVTPRPEQYAEPRPVTLLRVLAAYGLVSLAVLVAVHIFTLQLGLPGWFFPSAVVVLLVCLPIIVATALVQGATFAATRAGTEVKAPSTAARRWLTWRNAVGVMVAAFALLGLAVTGYMAARVMGIGPWGTLIARGVLEERDLIVLADFEDHTGDSLALTVTDLFRGDLVRSAVVRVADRGYVRRVLREQMGTNPGGPLTYELAREVARRRGLKAVVAGEIDRIGSSYVLSARLVVAETGRELYSHKETAEGLDPILPAISRLSAHLLERIGESLKTVQRGRATGRFAWTSSLEAARLYTQANRALQRGESRKQLDRANQAIEIDTLFASAYNSRAIALERLGIERAQSIADFTRAYELRHRAPPYGRHFIEAMYHGHVTGDHEKLVEAYTRILELEPYASQTTICPCPGEILGALNNLGSHYYQARDYVRAEEMIRRRLTMDSARGRTTYAPWSILTRILFDQGRFHEAEQTLIRWEARMPDNPIIPLRRAQLAAARGDYKATEVYLRSWQELRPESRLDQARFHERMARLAQLQGKLAEAEEHLGRAMAFHEEEGRDTEYIETGIGLAGLRVWLLGDTIRALETMSAALQKTPLDSIEAIELPYVAIAGFYAFAGEAERARELLTEWETVVPPDLRQIQEVDRRVGWGAVALAEGRAEEARTEFRFVQERGACPICGLPLLAQGYELAGQPDSALAMYEQYVTTPYNLRALRGTSPADGFDPYWLPVAYERLADLYEQRADRAKAIHYYGKLVDLWKDADAELQSRVEASRRAIEALSPAR